MSKWLRVGQVRLSKKGKEQIYVSEDVSLKKGTYLHLSDPRTRPGITEEQLSKIPEYVIFDIVVPPNEG
jgi:hypothetical protein